MHNPKLPNIQMVLLPTVRATQTFIDPYGPQPIYAPYGHILLIILYIFPFLFPSKRHYHPPHHQQSYDRPFSITTASCMSSPPHILLFVTHSPVICKDFFSLVYMYKSSRYYAVFHIDLGPMFPQSTPH